MRRYTPRRGVTAPRWFVAALLGGTAALTAATATLPSASPAPGAQTQAFQTQAFQIGSITR
ncbi:hypothetical protein [Caulobacter sp. RL271]|jgi:hypothetical protein|uniref:Uncharacterized protein n=1 Tax=Caulobacter segnis TaxID=88688 RepID=A0ABY4ZZ76_9CAUL|nr:hypothetical protein [Caulobacter segnis]USQ97659.1 hypothetical protein MZV50_09060 [Caulobacter segnis]